MQKILLNYKLIQV